MAAGSGRGSGLTAAIMVGVGGGGSGGDVRGLLIARESSRSCGTELAMVGAEH